MIESFIIILEYSLFCFHSVNIYIYIETERGLGWRLSQPGFDPSYGKLICLVTLNETDLSVDDYRDIYSPTPVGLSSLANEVIVLPLAFIASLFIYELRSR